MTLPTVNAYTGAVTVTGVVRDAQGRGVSGASVSIISGKTKLYTTTSVSGGSFAFNSKSLSDGTYTIQASKSNYLAGTSSFTVSWYWVFGWYYHAIPAQVISIRAIPVANPNGNYYGSANQQIQFSSSGSYDPDGSISAYYWTFGDGGTSTSANPVHSYTTPNTYTVSLRVTDNQGIQKTTSTNAYIGATPPISHPGGPYYAETTDEITFNSSLSSDPDGTITKYEWDFGDGSNNTYDWNSTHAYVEPGNYTVTLKVTDNHDAETVNTTMAYITPKPPVIVINSPYAELATDPIQFNSTGTFDPDGNITEYVWTFGDGSNSTEPNPSHIYVLKGNYTVTLTVKDNHNATTTVTTFADVSPKPPVAQIAGTPTGESGDAIQFSSSSYDFDNDIEEYKWTFGDGSGTFYDENPTHTYDAPGNYTVTLTVVDEDDLENTIVITITVENIDPVAVIVAPESHEAESPSAFSSEGSSDEDGSIVSYLWEFGDGETSTEANPEYTYMAEGTYTVRLTVTDDFSGTGTVTVVIEVAPKPFPIIYIAAAVIVAGAAAGYYFLVMKKKEPEIKPTALKLTVSDSSVAADSKSSTTVTVELVDDAGMPIGAKEDVEVNLSASLGTLEGAIKIAAGGTKGTTRLISGSEVGTVRLSAEAKGLRGSSLNVDFVEKRRYCMHCGAQMAIEDNVCPDCGQSPPSGVDVKECINCGEVIPSVAKFCRECGAAQVDKEE